MTTARFVIGVVIIIGENAKPRSTIKMSPDTNVISLPELVDVTDFIESFPSLSYRALTKIFLIFKPIM